MEREEIRKKQTKLIQLFQYENFKYFKKLQKIIRKNIKTSFFWGVVVGCFVVLGFFVLFFTGTTESASWVGHSQKAKSMKQNISTEAKSMKQNISTDFTCFKITRASFICILISRRLEWKETQRGERTMNREHQTNVKKTLVWRWARYREKKKKMFREMRGWKNSPRCNFYATHL